MREQLTNQKTKSLQFLFEEKGDIKSMENDSQGLSKVGRGWVHIPFNLITSLEILEQVAQKSI